MSYSDQFFNALGVDPCSKRSISAFSRKSGVSVKGLKFYNQENKLPTGRDLDAILEASGISEITLMLRMGRLSKDVINALQDKAELISDLINDHCPPKRVPSKNAKEVFNTSLGSLYQGDCYDVLCEIESDSVDLVFADPPFNLNKIYPSNIDDNIKSEKYIHWCEEWINECIRILKPGGSLFLWNLPKWNSVFSEFLEGRLTFKHWIAVDLKFGLPVQGKLYPSHYSLLYYVKGEKAKSFHPDRLPMQVCPSCFKELKDYGGYKNKMNPAGINLSDIWVDIPPVRHSKYKRRLGANELSLKLLDRIIEMSSDVGDIVLDPFGGSGSTYMAAELKSRRWIGCEIGPVDVIIDRFNKIDEERAILNRYRNELNSLFPKKVKNNREKLGLWTCDTFNNEESEQLTLESFT